ncbi:hypothetical protein C5749_02935 [Sphingobacterium gobiense]|uniref:Uncharacterized protein n=1 Tax=Sphingobacterium gobiense TaxID=1382456 RepID=A0A2S9JSG1_9SPHI|nr:hypothetical protein C5749_02935 [Sphingobacterium gobiense]
MSTLKKGVDYDYLNSIKKLVLGEKYCIFAIAFGKVSEWSNEQTWKVCIRDDCIEGSNPSLSAELQSKG